MGREAFIAATNIVSLPEVSSELQLDVPKKVAKSKLEPSALNSARYPSPEDKLQPHTAFNAFGVTGRSVSLVEPATQMCPRESSRIDAAVVRGSDRHMNHAPLTHVLVPLMEWPPYVAMKTASPSFVN